MYAHSIYVKRTKFSYKKTNYDVVIKSLLVVQTDSRPIGIVPMPHNQDNYLDVNIPQFS